MKKSVRNNNIRSFLANTKVVAAIAVLVIFAAIITYFSIINPSNQKVEPQDETITPPRSINYDPPTKEEEQSADTQKAENIQREATDKATAENINANVVIVDASQYDNTIEVRSYISNVYEDGGECKITFTKDRQTITHTKTGFKDAKTTQCGTLEVNRSEFSTTGIWKVMVQYNSSSATGSSEKTLTIK